MSNTTKLPEDVERRLVAHIIKWTQSGSDKTGRESFEVFLAQELALQAQEHAESQDQAVHEERKRSVNDFVLFLKHWVRGHKKEQWSGILMDTHEFFMEKRAEEFLNWEQEERIASLKALTEKSEG